MNIDPPLQSTPTHAAQEYPGTFLGIEIPRFLWVSGALLLGFVLFNVVAVGAAFTLAFVGWDWVAGMIWFFIKAFAFVFVFVWMRATFPRVRIDHLIGCAWKWLLPAALLNLFLTATAIVVVDALKGGAL